MSLRSLAPYLVAITLVACGDDGDAPTDTPAPMAPSITTVAALPDIPAGSAATLTLTATGDEPITWRLSAGTITPGMTVSSDAIYSGTPTQLGSSTFTVTAENALGSDTLELTQIVIAPPADAIALVGNDTYVDFPTTFPFALGTSRQFVGVVAGEEIVSIDRRPINGQLYGIGFNDTTTAVSLYALHPVSRAAIPVGPPVTFATNVVGPRFGMDVNPVVDRVRVVTSAGQNFRLNPNTGAAVDADGGTAGIQRDGNINGLVTTASETAYTNNTFYGNAITTQYTINAGTLFIQNPPNNGTLTTPRPMDLVMDTVGFDIAPGVDAPVSGSPATGEGYAIINFNGQTANVGGTVNLATGEFTMKGSVPITGVCGLALPTSRTIIGLFSAGTTLFEFAETTPATIRSVTITGVTAGEQLVGIDWRPATGQLLALGINATANTGTLYLLDPTTGTATVLGAPGQIAFTTNGTTQMDFPDPSTTSYGVDVDPATDRVRVVTSTGLNFRVTPAGAPVDGKPLVTGTNTDGNINGVTTALDSIAFTNGHPTALPGLSTEYALDATTNSLHLVTAPDAGTTGAAIAVTLNGAPLDFTSVAGFDIPQSVTVELANAVVVEGSAYASLTVGGVTSLYRIDLPTGAATELATIGNGTESLRSLTVGQ